MSTQLSEIGRTLSLLKAQDADLAIANELMRERGKLEQNFIEGLQALVEKHKPQREEENCEYTKVLITAFEQEIEARSARKTDVPEHPSIDEGALAERIPMIQHLREKHQAHEGAYAAVLASRDKLKRWKDSTSEDWEAMRMPLVELEYRWSIHYQRQSAQILGKWYQTNLLPLVESHHSALEDTKTMMMRTIHANVDCASTCSRIYSRALEIASNLLPLNHRASIEEELDAETNSYAFRPLNYYNWFYDGQPSPLLFGIGIMVIEQNNVPYRGLRGNYRGLNSWERLAMLQAERENDLHKFSAKGVTLFELGQYSPLLPLNSMKFEQLKYSKIISRRELPSLLAPDESAWDPLGSMRRKELVKLVITRAPPAWLTFRADVEDIVNILERKWDFENDRPKPRET